MKTKFVMFHCYNKRKDFFDHKDCVGSFGMRVDEGTDSVGLLNLINKYVPLSTVYITFKRSLGATYVNNLPIEIEEVK